MKTLDALTTDLRQALEPMHPQPVQAAFFLGAAALSSTMPKEGRVAVGLLLSEGNVAAITPLIPLARAFRKKGVVFPYLLTEQFIESSLDSFPLEFIELQQRHRLILGESPFTRRAVDVRNVRLQCERELKGKGLHLKSALLASASDRDLVHVMLAARNDFTRIFLGLLMLKGDASKVEAGLIPQRVAELYGLDSDILARAAAGDIPSKGITEFFGAYVRQIDKLSTLVDEGAL